VTGWSPAKSRESGIETVFQDRALAVQQTIVRNIFMGREIAGPLGFLDNAKERAEAERLMREIGFTSKVFSPDSIVGQLSGGERQGVAIARAIYNKADLIILDEPTTALSLTETEKVFRFVRTVRESGRSILFIGHNIHHVFGIAERFVVLDRGRVALEVTKEQVRSAERLIAFMEHVAHPSGTEPPRRPVPQQRSRRMTSVPQDDSSCSDGPQCPRPLPRRQPRLDRDAGRVRGDDAGLHGRGAQRVHAMADLQLGAGDAAGGPVLVVPLVFIVVSGEIDLSFPATMGFAAWIFASWCRQGSTPSSPCWRGGNGHGAGLRRGRDRCICGALLSGGDARAQLLLRGLILI
jgi:simple sugar transport system ATP-binding protein